MGAFNKSDASTHNETNQTDSSANAGTNSNALSGLGGSVRVFNSPPASDSSALAASIQKIALIAAAAFGVLVVIRLLRRKKGK